jgi:hypothetical protein
VVKEAAGLPGVLYRSPREDVISGEGLVVLMLLWSEREHCVVLTNTLTKPVYSPNSNSN